MTFQDCCVHCAGDQELVQQFNRLTGHHMGEPSSPFDAAIDAACNYDKDKDAFPDFIAFVHDCIWKPLITQP